MRKEADKRAYNPKLKHHDKHPKLSPSEKKIIFAVIAYVGIVLVIAIIVLYKSTHNYSYDGTIDARIARLNEEIQDALNSVIEKNENQFHLNFLQLSEDYLSSLRSQRETTIQTIDQLTRISEQTEKELFQYRYEVDQRNFTLQLSLISYFTDNYRPMGLQSASSFLHYAETQQMNFYLNTNYSLSFTPVEQQIMNEFSKPHYAKFLLLLKFIELRLSSPSSSPDEWLLFMDADILIMNYSHSLRDLLEQEVQHKLDTSYLFISKDINGINTGVFALRVNQWSADLMRMCISDYNNRDLFQEQSALDHQLTLNSSLRSHTKFIHPKRQLQSYLTDYKLGEFCIHFVGISSKPYFPHFLDLSDLYQCLLYLENFDYSLLPALSSDLLTPAP